MILKVLSKKPNEIKSSTAVQLSTWTKGHITPIYKITKVPNE